jgi:hypothetical protein
MPNIPYSNPFVEWAGMNFNYNDAFLDCASQYNLGGAISSFNTASISSLNVSSINGAVPGSGGLPAGTITGSWLSYNGSNWIEGGSGGNINLGYNAGNTQQELCVAIGEDAGRVNQQIGAIAIGFEAGKANQGVYSIAIGKSAGVTNQAGNSIVLNASSGTLEAPEAGLYVNPIRNIVGNTSWLTYNPTSGEVCFDTLLPQSLGSPDDAPSLTGSVWAYAQQAEQDAQNALSNAGTANDWITTESTPNAVNAIGTYSDTASDATSLWALAKQAQDNALLAQTAAGAVETIVGNSANEPSLLTTCYAYAKQAELDAQKSSMIWDISGALGATTVCNLASPYNWTITEQLIRTITIPIPAGWVARSSTLPTLFIWTTFASGNPTTQQHFTYQIGAGPELPLAGTSITRPYLYQGPIQYTPITGVITGVPLAPGNTLTIRIHGKVSSGTHAMNNPKEQAFGVLSTAF